MNEYQILFNVLNLSGIAFSIMAILTLLFVFYLDKKFHDGDRKLVHINSVISTAYQKEKWHQLLTFIIFLLLTVIAVVIIIAIIVIADKNEYIV